MSKIFGNDNTLGESSCIAGERCSCPPGSDARAKCNLRQDAKPIKVFGLITMDKKQQALITAHCFGDCGKVSMAGAIMDDQLGGLMVCCEVVCPWLGKEMAEPYGTAMSFGKPHEIYLRALSEMPNATRATLKGGVS